MKLFHSVWPAVLLCSFVVFTIGYGQDRGRGVDSRESVKTSLPQGENASATKNISLSDLISLAEPPDDEKNDSRYDKQRIPAFANPLGLKEGDVVAVTGWLHVVRLMGDGDYNLRFSGDPASADHYIVAEIPDVDDVPQNLRPLVKTARDFVQSKVLGGKSPSRQGTTIPNASYVQITGQLFFNDANLGNPPGPDNQGLQRASNWEIHPGLAMTLAQPNR